MVMVKGVGKACEVIRHASPISYPFHVRSLRLRAVPLIMSDPSRRRDRVKVTGYQEPEKQRTLQKPVKAGT